MGVLLQPPLVRCEPFAQVSPVLIIKVFRSSGRPRGAKGQDWPFLARRLKASSPHPAKEWDTKSARRSPLRCLMAAPLQRGETLQS